MAKPAKKRILIDQTTRSAADDDSKSLAKKFASHELVFGIVGHVGSGTSTIAETLENVLNELQYDGNTYQCEIIKAREVIENWADEVGEEYPKTKPFSIDDVKQFQDLGDKMRKDHSDHAAVARHGVRKVREIRAHFQGAELVKEMPIIPDGHPRAFILDSIRHPAEVKLLRHIYRDAFVLIGVVCEHGVRKTRISEKYRDAGLDRADEFMRRDAKAGPKHGQRVSDAFHLSDFFIDNTAQRYLENDPKKSNPDWDINESLLRLINLVSHEKIERPKLSETAMYKAAGAGMRSACLSRQVGAALVDSEGNIISTGTNEVPKAGGGVYGESFDEDAEDDRCFITKKICSNTVEQSKISKQIAEDLKPFLAEGVKDVELVQTLKDGRVGGLLEFSRAVHAEMDALLAAGRQGKSTIGSRLYVTTFPCHYCARHIVSAGVDEVQFIEPYPKSKAFDLHGDSILNDDAKNEWVAPSLGGKKVLFTPFTGVAPRMYRRAFQKDRNLKNGDTGEMNIQLPEWGSPYDVSQVSYAEFEVRLTESSSNNE